VQEEFLMNKSVGIEKGHDTDLLEDTKIKTIKVQDWMSDPEKHLQEIENAEILLERLLQEREALLVYIKALRSWARDVIGGIHDAKDQPSDMVLLEAKMNLPGYLRKEIQNDEELWDGQLK
jgi:hypothetical protein